MTIASGNYRIELDTKMYLQINLEDQKKKLYTTLAIFRNFELKIIDQLAKRFDKTLWLVKNMF